MERYHATSVLSLTARQPARGRSAPHFLKLKARSNDEPVLPWKLPRGP